MKFKCQVCGKEFETTKKRPVKICPECIDKLRMESETLRATIIGRGLE